MKNQLLILLGLCTILNCTTKTNSVTNNISVSQTEAKAIDTVLYTNETLHYFTSTTDKDTFRITLTGQSIKNGQFKFQIISKDKGVVLNEDYEATMLLDYGLKPNPTEKELEDYIKIRIDQFFIEDNFRQPAISRTDTFDEDYGEKEIWDDIIADQTSIGFYYLIGEEDGRHIAFSKRLGKVVMYYNCC